MEIQFIKRPIFDEDGQVTDTQKIPVIVSYSVLRAFEKQTGKSVTDKKADINMDDAFTLFYLALKFGHKHLGRDFTYDEEEAELILDLCMDQWAKIQTKFFPTQGKKKGTKVSQAAK